MRATKTLLDFMAEDCWTIRIPKPRLSSATVRWSAALALSLGFNIGFVAEAFGAEPADCQASAELHYAISGGQDAAYEDALEACSVGMTYTEWTSYEASPCEQHAGHVYDLTGDPEDFAVAEQACEAGEVAPMGTYSEAAAWARACASPTGWVEPVAGSSLYTVHCGDADGNEVF